MREKYVNALLDIIEFDLSDVISTSDCPDDTFVCPNDTTDNPDCIVD